jgi:hypothetical protein
MGTVAFHFARLDLVLLRDIRLLGTATTILLTCLRYGRTVRSSVCLELPQNSPAGVNGTVMPVVRPCLSKPRAAFNAQARAVVLALGREWEREHQGVPEGRLKIEQVPVQRVPVILRVTAVLLITEQFLAPDFESPCYRFEAARALTRQRRAGRHRDEDALADRLQPDVKAQVRALRDTSHASTEVRWRGYDPSLAERCSRAPRNGPGVEDERPLRAAVSASCLAGGRHENHILSKVAGDQTTRR